MDVSNNLDILNKEYHNALKDNDFILAKELCEELEKQVKLLRS